MQSNDFTKSSIAAAALAILFMCFWEFYWRDRGYPVSYNDDKVLWASRRKMIYGPADRTTVFIGDSRVKFDIDLATWKALTGEDGIQLALVGTSPRPVLQNLANDEKFTGKVIMGAADPAFYTLDSTIRIRSAKDGIEYYQAETPAQDVNAQLDFALESKLVFLEEGKFGLNALLNTLPLKNRPGVSVATGPPRAFSNTIFARQSLISPKLLEDSQLRNSVINYWAQSALRNRLTPIKGDTLELFFKQVKSYIDKIRSRGGDVVLIRPPSVGAVLARENKLYPRNQYWDKMLMYTGTKGFFYADYPQTKNLDCPEESHLYRNDAALFTQTLIHFLRDQGWKFSIPADSVNAVKQ